MRTALGRGDWATVLRAFLDTGLSQTVIAARAGLSQSQVSRLANGKSRDPGLHTVKALCDGLAIPRRLAGLLDKSDEEVEATDRRQFLTGSLGVAASALLPHSDLGDERLLMATTLSYRQLEQRTPSRDLMQPVTAHLSLARNLTLRASGKQRERLSAALSEVAGLAAWVHADLAEPAKTRQLYKMSIAAARDSRQALLAIYMQGSLGQYAADAGDPIHGIRIIRDASARLPRSAPDSARAWLATLEGQALGHLGDRSALRQLDQAARCADAACDQEPVWPWIFPFTEGKIARYRAVTASRLDLPKVASAAFDKADPVAGSPKQAATAEVERARSLAAAGHLDEACRIAAGAFDTGQSFGSERVCQAVRELRRSLGRGRSGTALDELDERLHRRYMDGG